MARSGPISGLGTLKPDLVLLDLAMPEMNGAEAAFVLKKMMPQVPIILFTMHGDNMGRYLTSAIGVDVGLSKPDGIAALAESVNAVLALSSESPVEEKKPYVKPTVTTRPLTDRREGSPTNSKSPAENQNGNKKYGPN